MSWLIYWVKWLVASPRRIFAWIKWMARDGLRATRLIRAGNEARQRHDDAVAAAYYEESLGLVRRLERWDIVAQLRHTLGWLALDRHDCSVARHHFEQAISLARTQKSARTLGSGILGLAAVASRTGDYRMALRLCDECLTMWTELDNPLEIAAVYRVLASFAETIAESRRHTEQALAIYRKRDYQSGVVSALCSLGHYASPAEANEHERACLEECLEILPTTGRARTRSYVLNNLGNIERYAGNLDRASELYREGLNEKLRLEDEWAISYTLDGFAAIESRRHNAINAARLYGAASAIRERLGTPLEPIKRAQYDAEVAEARGLLPAAEFECAWRDGAALTVAEAVEEATVE